MSRKSSLWMPGVAVLTLQSINYSQDTGMLPIHRLYETAAKKKTFLANANLNYYSIVFASPLNIRHEFTTFSNSNSTGAQKFVTHMKCSARKSSPQCIVDFDVNSGVYTLQDIDRVNKPGRLGSSNQYTRERFTMT